jgi:hypothetical protein
VAGRRDRRSVGPSRRRRRSARLGGDPVGIEPRGPHFHRVGHAPPYRDDTRHHSPDDEHDSAVDDRDHQPHDKPDNDAAAADDDSAAAHDRPDDPAAAAHHRPDHLAPAHDHGRADDDYGDPVTA